MTDRVASSSGTGHDAAARWADCPACVEFCDANRDAVIFAAASVGIEHGLTTPQALSIYMKGLHDGHA